MAKATIAKLQSVNGNIILFHSESGYDFYVTSFFDSILVLKPSVHCDIYHFAEIVAGCFEDNSTFKNVTEIHFIYNGKQITVTKDEHTTPEIIVKKWCDAPYND